MQGLDIPPPGRAFDAPELADEPTPPSSANLVVPVPDAPAAPPGLVMVPGLSDDSDIYDDQASSSGKITGHITDRDTLVGEDVGDEGFDTFVQGAVPRTSEDVLALEDDGAHTSINARNGSSGELDALHTVFGVAIGEEDRDAPRDDDGAQTAFGAFDRSSGSEDASPPSDESPDGGPTGAVERREEARTTLDVATDAAPKDHEATDDTLDANAQTLFGDRAPHAEQRVTPTDVVARARLGDRAPPAPERATPTDLDPRTRFGDRAPPAPERATPTDVDAHVETDPTAAALEPPTLRPGDAEDATAIGVRTVAARPRASVDEGRDLDTLVGGGLPDFVEAVTPSGAHLSDGDIEEVHPTDTQVAVVHPDEDFQPEDLALTSQDDPMPPEGTPPAIDASPIGHGAMAPQPNAPSRRWLPVGLAIGAWATLTGVLFFASILRDGGPHEAAWNPNSAVLWLRIALNGGVGVLLVLALRRRLALSTQLFRLSWEWAGIAILAGACVGAMAPFSQPAAPLAIALILAAALAIAEEVFFRGVLGRVLAASPLKTRTAIAIAAVLYGLYYGTYFVIWQHDDPIQIALALTMITVGAALPYAILQDLTKGVLAPLLCHVSVNVAGVVVRTYF